MSHVKRNCFFMGVVMLVLFGCAQGGDGLAIDTEQKLGPENAFGKSECKVGVVAKAVRNTTLVRIDAMDCHESVSDFLTRLDFELQNALPPNPEPEAVSVTLVGPLGEDNVASLESAWGYACGEKNGASRETRSADFERAYATSEVVHGVITAFQKYEIHVEFSSIDNFYPISSDEADVLHAPDCDAGLLIPIIWFVRE